MAGPVTGPLATSRLRQARPIVVDYLLLTAGAVCVALAVDLFLVPNDVVAGVTLLEGRGGYTAAERPVLLCVVARSEESYLKELIERVDPRAFVVITEATDVLGEGFRDFGRR